VTEHSAEDLTKSANGPGAAEPDPPAANQGKDEPIASAPDEAAQGSSGGRAQAQAGSSSNVPGEQGEPPRPMETDNEASAANMTAASMPASATGGVPTPGDSHGVAVPAVQAAAGTSEESEKVDGVRITSLAPPGKPDGEVDTRG
jgi:hypothetical protein